MSTTELLWTIREERRREAARVARERWTVRPGRGRDASIGRLVGWVRQRLRVLRDPLAGSAGWKPSP
jgi:hypothetical protein